MSSPESALQSACVTWFRLQYPRMSRLMFAIPNGHHRNKRTACILKAEGVVAGVSDLILLVPSKTHACLCIEMKAGKSGRQSQHQLAFQRDAEGVGNRYIICRTFDDFRNAVTQHLNER
jgi:hypothetical protein